MTSMEKADVERQWIIERYLGAKQRIIENGFAEEIDWQDNVRLADITEPRFLSEYAWVVLSSGMRESVIRRKFPFFSAAFHDWQSSKAIVKDAAGCKRLALKVFGHRQKIEAIISVAEKIFGQGFEYFRKCLQNSQLEFIRSLPFMGPATSYHLAKNIGMDVAKPDRHLVRIAQATGFQTPGLLCQEISRRVGDRISVVDLVLWRFATIEQNYLHYFASAISR
ncbi:MAG: hypothetical protein ACLQPD_14815 [Desulfomonilaceae bacterium]